MNRSETSWVRSYVEKYCRGMGLDIGFGGDPIVKDAITFDLHKPYTRVGYHPQIMQGDCMDLSMFCDNALEYIYSSHLLEDFSYMQQINIILEWRRVLQHRTGRLIICCPDQQRYVQHCRNKKEEPNEHHKESDYSHNAFLEKVYPKTGAWRIVDSNPSVYPYSWYIVLYKA